MISATAQLGSEKNTARDYATPLSMRHTRPLSGPIVAAA
jgi:hypothetical protein